MSGNWQLPLIGTQGTIKNKHPGGKVTYLSTNGNIEAGSVVEEVDLFVDDGSQQWERSDINKQQYFTLKNPKSGKFLSGPTHSHNTLTIEGTASFLCVIVYFPCWFQSCVK